MGKMNKKNKKGLKKTNNTRDSLVVTDPTTNLAVRGLSKEDLTGLRVFHYLWSFVEILHTAIIYKGITQLHTMLHRRRCDQSRLLHLSRSHASSDMRQFRR